MCITFHRMSFNFRMISFIFYKQDAICIILLWETFQYWIILPVTLTNYTLCFFMHWSMFMHFVLFYWIFFGIAPQKRVVKQNENVRNWVKLRILIKTNQFLVECLKAIFNEWMNAWMNCSPLKSSFQFWKLRRFHFVLNKQCSITHIYTLTLFYLKYLKYFTGYF